MGSKRPKPGGNVRGSRRSRPRVDTPSTRTSARASQRANARTDNRAYVSSSSISKSGSTAAAGQGPDSSEEVRERRARGGVRITQHAIILTLVLIILLASYATTLRVYFIQRQQIAQTREQIAQHEQTISSLNDEVARWDDPEYVKTQARDRLGWVVPGETGYQVVDENNQPYGGGSRIGAAQLPEDEYPETWWEKLWRTVAIADNPQPVESSPAPSPIVTVDTPEGP